MFLTAPFMWCENEQIRLPQLLLSGLYKSPTLHVIKPLTWLFICDTINLYGIEMLELYRRFISLIDNSAALDKQSIMRDLLMLIVTLSENKILVFEE